MLLQLTRPHYNILNSFNISKFDSTAKHFALRYNNLSKKSLFLLNL